MRRFAIVPILLLTSSCILTWQTVYASASPDGSAEVRVEHRGCLADCLIRVVLKKGWRTRELMRRGDCYIGFAHAVWEGSKVSIFVNGTYCGTAGLAFDLSTERAIPFEAADGSLRKAIVDSYQVRPEELTAAGGDVFRWIEDGNRATQEFFKRYRAQSR